MINRIEEARNCYESYAPQLKRPRSRSRSRSRSRPRSTSPILRYLDGRVPRRSGASRSPGGTVVAPRTPDHSHAHKPDELAVSRRGVELLAREDLGAQRVNFFQLPLPPVDAQVVCSSIAIR